MSPAHFFVERLDEPHVVLSAADSRHALRSLRLQAGERLTLSDGAGGLADARLQGAEDGRAVVKVEKVRLVERPSPSVCVALAPPKGERLAWAVQKLAELGCSELTLISTERSVRTWEGDRGEKIAARLRKVAREAAMQSRQPFVMDLRGPLSLGEALPPGETVVVLWEAATASLRSVLPPASARIRLVVGPEGGFSEDEVRTAERRGAALAGLGPGILRTETAALVGAALTLAHYGRLG